MKPAYYNEIDADAAGVLRRNITRGWLPAGDVDERSIRDVRADDLAPYGACHFFAGIGGLPLGLRQAGMADDFPIWTGGWPCQPFSVAGQRKAFDDDRDLWPELFRLLAQARPAWLLGENVAGFADLGLDRTLFDLERAGYASRAFAIPAVAVGATHERMRCWIVARYVADGDRIESPARTGGALRDWQEEGTAERCGSGPLADTDGRDTGAERQQRSGEQRQQSKDDGVGGAIAVADDEKRGRSDGSVANARSDCQERRPQESHRGCGGDVADRDDAGLEVGRGERSDTRAERAAVERSGDAVVDAEIERRGEGRAEPELRGGRSAPARTGVPAFPPGPADLDGWRRVLAVRPDLAPATTQSGVRGVAHGVPGRVARLKMLGNAVVPQVVTEIGRAILKAAAP